MMDQKKQISSGDFVCCDRLDSLSSKYPWFVVQNPQDDIDDQILSSLHNPLLKYQCRIPELSGQCIRGYFHGWMILSNHPHNITWSLWNPSTSKIIYLPPLFLKDGDYDSIQECCLSAPPDDPNSVLLFTRTNRPTFVFCQLNCKRKKKLRNKPRWTEMSYSHQLKRITWDGKLVHNLTCCNGKIYGLNSDSYISVFVIQLEIAVRDKEVVIKLLLFGSAPFALDNCFQRTPFLKGSDTELYYIVVGYHHWDGKKIPDDVGVFKLDMTSVNWDKLNCLKKWDISDIVLDEVEPEDLEDSDITQVMWEEMHDLKGANFCVDLGRNNLMLYSPAIALESGGYIHIRDKMEKIIYSYNVYCKTIVPSHMHPSVLPTSHVSVLERRFEDGHRETKCTVDSKQYEDEVAVTLITDDEVEVSESLTHYIPSDVLEMIMKFCVGVEYMNFRATCKRCQLAAPVMQWRSETSLRRLQNYSVFSPWLMVVEKKRGIITFTDPLLGDNYFMKNPLLAFVDDRHYCSRFGWFLFKTSGLGIAFLNPFTNDLHELPKPGYCLQSLCFSAPPTSPDCMVVGFTYSYVFTHFFAREPTWRRFSLSASPVPQSICFPTFCGGDLYALCNEGKIVVFKDLSEKHYSYKIFETEPPKSCRGYLANCYFVKCDQHLLQVIMAELGEPIEVFKLSDSTRKWEKINGIGKHMIYISDTTCLCIEAKTPEMENKIYLPQLCPMKRKIVFYSLDTCTFHTFNGKSNEEKLVDIFTTSHLSAQAWIEPSWSGLLRPEDEERHSSQAECSLSNGINTCLHLLK